MSRPQLLIILLVLIISCHAQEPTSSARPPLTQRQVCAQYAGAVVAIEAGEGDAKSLGTGFFVSSDGFIMTAAHVVLSPAGRYFATITATLADGTTAVAKPAGPPTIESVGRDFAILKVDGRSGLQFLSLGSIGDAVPGSDATIIGHPFSAATVVKDIRSTPKFCLAATVAASENATVAVSGTAPSRNGRVPFQRDIKVNVVYFQGPSVKGVSGSPLILRDTGNVIGIITLKLTGIGKTLNDLRSSATRGAGGVLISGVDPNAAFRDIVTVLDEQLANGLGAATGIADASSMLREAQRRANQQ